MKRGLIVAKYGALRANASEKICWPRGTLDRPWYISRTVGMRRCYWWVTTAARRARSRPVLGCGGLVEPRLPHHLALHGEGQPRCVALAPEEPDQPPDLGGLVEGRERPELALHQATGGLTLAVVADPL